MGFGEFLRVWHADRVLAEIKCPFCKKSIAKDDATKSGTLIICPHCKRTFKPGDT